MRRSFLSFFFIIAIFAIHRHHLNKRTDVLEKEIGQMIKGMIMVGFRDEDLDLMLKKNKAGGYILFNQDYLTGKERNLYNIENAKKVISRLQENKVNLIAVDNEGGPVNRLEKIEDFGNMLSVIDMSKLNRNDRILKYKFYMKKMKDLGITIDFAPVIDLQINKSDDFFMNVKKRLFSDNPRQISDFAIDFIDSARENAIITSLKHFPGHGSAQSDTHVGFVDVTKTWNPIELEPYKMLLSDKNLDLTMVMVSHIFNKNIDEKYPASMSHNTIHKYLREILNFDGVVVSDAIDMKALSANFSLEEIIINSINAGVNLIVHANQITYDKNIGEKIYKIILNGVYDGKIKKENVVDSFKKIDNLIEKRKNILNQKV